MLSLNADLGGAAGGCPAVRAREAGRAEGGRLLSPRCLHLTLPLTRRASGQIEVLLSTESADGAWTRGLEAGLRPLLTHAPGRHRAWVGKAAR